MENKINKPLNTCIPYITLLNTRCCVLSAGNFETMIPLMLARLCKMNSTEREHCSLYKGAYASGFCPFESIKK